MIHYPVPQTKIMAVEHADSTSTIELQPTKITLFASLINAPYHLLPPHAYGEWEVHFSFDKNIKIIAISNTENMSCNIYLYSSRSRSKLKLFITANLFNLLNL